MVQMVQVFGNLINNAASYSPAGSRIEIMAEPKFSKVKISIKDHGVGIPVSQHGNVFGKFFRADNVSKTIPGSGLGLYVAKSMVEAHGGKIWFESKENLGTTFFVELPIKQKDGKKEESDDRGG
jgi:two-component system sensor histidine kinase VicK